MAFKSSGPGTSTKGRCGTCSRPSTQRCSRCRELHYCDIECQKKDWPNHKWFCKSAYPKKDTSKRSVRGLFLPMNSEMPQFVEVPYFYWKAEGRNWSAPKMDIFLGNGYHERRIRDYKDGADHQRMITVYLRDNFMNEPESKPNQCVAAITNGKNINYWRGPLLVFRSDDVESVFSPDPQYVDIKKEDSTEVVAFFLEERNLNWHEDDKLKAFIFDPSTGKMKEI